MREWAKQGCQEAAEWDHSGHVVVESGICLEDILSDLARATLPCRRRRVVNGRAWTWTQARIEFGSGNIAVVVEATVLGWNAGAGSFPKPSSGHALGVEMLLIAMPSA